MHSRSALLRAMDDRQQDGAASGSRGCGGPWRSTAAFPPRKRYLGRRGQVSDGFDRLAGLGKLALSAEALAVSAKFNACFTDDEVNHCFAQLCAANYFGKARF